MAEMGWSCSDGEYMRPLTWVEIECWVKLMGLNLTPFEYNALHLLSVNYAGQYNAANNTVCDNPYMEIKIENAKKVENKLMSLFSMLRGKK